MNKMKITIVAVTTLLLIVVCVFVFRFIQSALFSATEALKTIGEAPLPTEVVEEKWVPPDMPAVDEFDIERGIDNVAAEEDLSRAVPTAAPDDDDDVQSVPVDETADELADTSPDTTPELGLPDVDAN